MFKKIAGVVLGVGVYGMTLTSVIASAKEAGSLQVKGSDTMVNLVQSWAEEFMNKQPGSFIAVTGGGSGTGLAALIGGSSDVAASSRQIKEQELVLAKKKGVDPREFKVALDGLAVVVHPKNPVSKLTLDQLAGIFSGQIVNWKELGGSNAPMVVLSREVNSGTHVYFKEHVLRKGDAKSAAEFSADALLLPSSQAIADEVRQNTDAIGYYGMGYVSKDQQAVSVAKDAHSPFVYPSVDNVLSGEYPISRPLFIYVNGEPRGVVKDFLDFVLSADGQKVVSAMDFVPVKK